MTSIKHISVPNLSKLKVTAEYNYPKYTYKGELFTGIEIKNLNKTSYTKGIKTGISVSDSTSIYFSGVNKIKVLEYYYHDILHGYQIIIDDELKETISFSIYDMGIAIETHQITEQNSNIIMSIGLDIDKNVFSKYNDLKISLDDIYENILEFKEDYETMISLVEIYLNKINLNLYSPEKITWLYYREKRMEKGYYNKQSDLLPYYILQQEMKDRVITEDVLPDTIKYIAGVDVAYDEMEQIMVGAVVVLDAKTLEVVEQVHHQMDITFPYIPGLFSFREVPPILEAYKQLNIKPDLIVCDAQGISHPKNVGMATHLGIELDVPTIGCAKKRLVGYYNKENLGTKRGDNEHLVWNSEKVGVALRTQNNTKPMFVSIGHKISLETAIDWVLKLTPKYRLPETTREADQLVNKIIKNRTEFDFLNDNDSE